MRDHSGTLCSPPVEKKKPSLKVTSRDGSIDPGKRTCGTSPGGPKLNGYVPLLATSRLKAGSGIIPNGISGKTQHSELPEQIKYSFESPAQARKASFSDEQGLPQWGLGKRSRCKPAKSSAPAAATGVAHHSAGKAKSQHLLPVVQADIPSSLKDKGLRHGTSISESKKEGALLGIVGGHTRSSNACHPNTITASCGAATGGRTGERERASVQKVDHGLRTRHQEIQVAAAAANQAHHHSHNVNNATFAVTPSSSEANQPPSVRPPPQHQRVDFDTLEWLRINLVLSRKEKEDDFFAIKGSKLPQRPKKRPKLVERAVHYITPGNSLVDIARGRYDVREKKCVKKKPGGLKAMESMESDSE